MAHRAIVDKARQPAAKPVLKSSEGWEIPCQPCLNSSINFVIGIVTSRDQRIQNKANYTENRGIRAHQAGRPIPARANKLACVVPGGREYWRQQEAGGMDEPSHSRGQRVSAVFPCSHG